MADKVVRAVLTYDVDQGKLQATLAGGAKVVGSVDEISAALQKAYDAGLNFDEAMASLASNTSPGLVAISADANAAAASIDNMADQTVAVKALTDDVLGLDTAIKSAAANASAFPQNFVGQGDVTAGGESSGPGGAVTKAGRAIFAAPAVGASTPIARGLIGAGALIDATGAGLGTLALAAGIAAPAVIATAIAIGKYNEELDKQKAILNAALSAQDTYYDALAHNTTEQSQAQVHALEQTNVAVRQQIAEIQGAIDKANTDAANSGNPIERLAVDQATGPLNDKLKELQGQLGENEQAAGRLTEGVKQGVFTTNDAAAAEKDLEKARRDGVDAAIKAAHQQVDFATMSAEELRKKQAELANTQLIDILATSTTTDQTQLNALNLEITQSAAALKLISETFLPIAEYADDVVESQHLQSASASELSSELASTTEDYNRLSAVISGLEATGAATSPTLDALKASLATDAQLIQDITATYLPLAQARELEIQTLKDQTKAADDVAKAEAALTKSQQDHEHAIDVANGNEAAAIEAAKATRTEALSEASRKAGIEEGKAQEKADAALLKAQEKYNADREKIERTFETARLNAVGDRDALGLKQAETKRDDDLKDLKASLAAQKKTIRDSLKEQRETIADNLKEQERTIERSYAKQVKTAQAALQKALDDEAYKYGLEDAARRSALATAKAEYEGFAHDLENIAAQLKAAADIPAGSTTTPTTTTGNHREIPRYKTGLDYVPYDNYLAYLDEGEGVLTKDQNQQRLSFSNTSGVHSTTNINVVIDGKSLRASSRSEALRAIRDSFDREGVA